MRICLGVRLSGMVCEPFPHASHPAGTTESLKGLRLQPFFPLLRYEPDSLLSYIVFHLMNE